MVVVCSRTDNCLARGRKVILFSPEVWEGKRLGRSREEEEKETVSFKNKSPVLKISRNGRAAKWTTVTSPLGADPTGPVKLAGSAV